MPVASAATDAVLATARRLMAETMPVIRRRGLTLVGLTITNLERGLVGEQLELPFRDRSRARLDAAIDELRDRFGTGAITRAAVLGLGRTSSPQADDHDLAGIRRRRGGG